MNARSSLAAPFAVVALVLLPLAFPRSSHAQQESAAAAMGEGAEPSASSSSSASTIVVEGGPNAPSPHWTQTRSFSQTRFWLLDPHRQSVEAWYTVETRHDGVDGATKHLWQIEYMVSPFRGLQLDVYFNYVKETGDDAHIEGAQIEARITPFRYGEVFLNPTLYLEWHPRNRDANRVEARLLLGGEIARRWRGAINPFVEQNVDSASGIRSEFVSDREIGVSAATSYAIVERCVALGGEVRAKKDQLGGNDRYYNVAQVGPAFWFSDDAGSMFLTASLLYGLTEHSDRWYSTVIVGLIR